MRPQGRVTPPASASTMRAKDDMNLTLWAAMLMLQVAFAVSSGPDAWPLAEDASVVSVLNAVVFGAACFVL